MNQFLILMIEGAFQLILSIFVPIWKNPFEGFKDEKIKNNKTLFIILFILYVLLQIVVNIYRIYCNVIYSPMARSLIDYFMNPFLNIFFFFVEKDFFDNVVYFVVSEILCCVMSFFGCVFNEYIVLYCCGLERETKDEIADRATIPESEKSFNKCELQPIFNNDNDNEEFDENDNNINYSNSIISVNSYLDIKI